MVWFWVKQFDFCVGVFCVVVVGVEYVYWVYWCVGNFVDGWVELWVVGFVLCVVDFCVGGVVVDYCWVEDWLGVCMVNVDCGRVGFWCVFW